MSQVHSLRKKDIACIYVTINILRKMLSGKDVACTLDYLVSELFFIKKLTLVFLV